MAAAEGLSRRRNLFDGFILVVLVLVVGYLSTRWASPPGLVESKIDHHAAAAIARGDGFTLQYLPDYRVRYARLEAVPSHETRPPGQAILLAAGRALGGSPSKPGRVPSVLIAIAVALLVWRLCRLANFERPCAVAAGLIVTVDPLMAYALATADAAVPATLLALGAVAILVSAQDSISLHRGIASMVLASAASLFRRDGFVIVLTVLFVYLRRGSVPRHGRGIAKVLAILAAAWIIPQAPWFAYSVLVWGTLPSSFLACSVLRTPSAMVTYGLVPTFADILPSPDFVAGFLATAGQVLSSVLLRDSLILLAPFVIVALVAREKPLFSRILGLQLLWSILAISLVFPGHRGAETIWLSGVLTLPAVVILGLTGIRTTGDWLARQAERRRQSTVAQHVRSIIVVVPFALLLVTGGLWWGTIGPAGHAIESFAHLETIFEGIDRSLDERGVDRSAAIMTTVPQAVWHWTKRPAIPYPVDDDPGVLLEVARRYHADYVLVFHLADHDCSWSAERYPLGDSLLVRVARGHFDAAFHGPASFPFRASLPVTGYSLYELLSGGS